MKKFILSLTIVAFLASALGAYAVSSSQQVKAAIQKYKAKNYIGCLQDTQMIVNRDPSNGFAYYYQALAYAKLGKTLEAEEAFNKVITLNGNKTLVDCAQRGIKCLNGEDGCKPETKEQTDLDKFIHSNKFYGNSVQSELNQKRLNNVKDRFNDTVDDALPQKSEMPTNDEIANAVKTLAKAGLNPLAGMNGYNPAMMGAQSAEMMQMNMLLGNNNNSNNSMNMLPMLMMAQQNGQKISPEIIQSMMMSNMASDYGMGQTY